MKRIKDDNLNKNEQKNAGSRPHDSFSKKSISDQIGVSPAMEQELKEIFNSTLNVLQSICKQRMFSPESQTTVRMLRNTYFKFYDKISKNGTVPFFPLVTRTDLARVIDNASTHTSVDTFLADYTNNMPCKAQLGDEKAGQLVGLFNQMATVNSVSKLFEETFFSHGEGLVLPDDMEYKAVSLWIERLIEVYPFSGRKSLPRPQSRAQTDCALMVLTEAEHSTALIDPRTHRVYSDPLKEHLGKALDSLATLGSKVGSFQIVEAELADFNKAIVPLLIFLARTKKHGMIVKSLWTFLRVLRGDVETYMQTSDNTHLNGSIADMRDELLELWPSEGESKE